MVIPVAGAAAELEECIASLQATTDLARHRLQLVLDGPAAPATEHLVAELSRREDVALQVLRHTRRQGFVASVNHAIERTRRDVVLLNSDTVLTAGWLEKLQRAAYSSPAIATATPFSNHATLCSLPRMGEENALPAGWSLERFAALVERVSERRYPRIPTGVGVCLYVKRRALDELGHFDQASFGLGYGEESEFCMRALRAGWLHVLDDATFIYHAGQRSFGRTRRPRVAAAHRTMRRLHPQYLPTIASFLAQDPLAPVRRRVSTALAEAEGRDSEPPPGDPVVHVVHGWPPYNHAGTEEYARWLALWQRDRRPVAVYARIADPFRDDGQAVELLDHGVRVRLVVNNFDRRNPLARNAIHDRRSDRDFARFLDQTRPALVHVHHLSGHSMSLVRVLRRRGLPYVFQVQDWWSLCARANLIDHRGRPCSGPGLGKCSRCLPLTRIPPGGLWSRALHLLRRRAARRVWKHAAALVMGSRFIAESFRAAGWRREAAGRVVPYGVPLADRPPDAAPSPRADGPRRVGYIGSILPHKGVHVLAEALRDLDEGELVLELWGDTSADPDYTARIEELVGSTRLALRGRFPDELKAEVLRSLDVLVVPSIGLESFGLVAREALACGTPVVATTAGALRELQGVEVVPPGDAAALRSALLPLLRQPDRLAELRRRIPPIKGFRPHAEEIEQIYRGIGIGTAGA